MPCLLWRDTGVYTSALLHARGSAYWCRAPGTTHRELHCSRLVWSCSGDCRRGLCLALCCSASCVSADPIVAIDHQCCAAPALAVMVGTQSKPPSPVAWHRLCDYVCAKYLAYDGNRRAAQASQLLGQCGICAAPSQLCCDTSARRTAQPA